MLLISTHYQIQVEITQGFAGKTVPGFFVEKVSVPSYIKLLYIFISNTKASFSFPDMLL